MQRWILGKRLADDDSSSLEQHKVTSEGCPIFLYLVAPQAETQDKTYQAPRRTEYSYADALSNAVAPPPPARSLREECDEVIYENICSEREDYEAPARSEAARPKPVPQLRQMQEVKYAPVSQKVEIRSNVNGVARDASNAGSDSSYGGVYQKQNVAQVIQFGKAHPPAKKTEETLLQPTKATKRETTEMTIQLQAPQQQQQQQQRLQQQQEQQRQLQQQQLLLQKQQQQQEQLLLQRQQQEQQLLLQKQQQQQEQQLLLQKQQQEQQLLLQKQQQQQYRQQQQQQPQQPAAAKPDPSALSPPLQFPTQKKTEKIPDRSEPITNAKQPQQKGTQQAQQPTQIAVSAPQPPGSTAEAVDPSKQQAKADGSVAKKKSAQKGSSPKQKQKRAQQPAKPQPTPPKEQPSAQAPSPSQAQAATQAQAPAPETPPAKSPTTAREESPGDAKTLMAKVHGWMCPTCTLVNRWERPGCEACATERPGSEPLGKGAAAEKVGEASVVVQ